VGPTIRYKKCTQSSCQSASGVEAFLRDFDMAFTPLAFCRTRQSPIRSMTSAFIALGRPARTRLAGNHLAIQIACRTYGRLVCHCTAMTSPRLMSPARADGAAGHNSIGAHQMTAWTAQWRRRAATRREPHEFTDPGHRPTVCAVPACDINKSGGLAEKNSARCGVMGCVDSTKETEYSYVSRADAATRC
jgi:hypothetical protein